MNLLLLNLLLALVWAALWGAVSVPALLTGYLIGFAVLWLIRGQDRYFRTVIQSVVLAIYFIKELVVSSVKVARDALMPNPDLHPAIVRMPLDAQSDLEIFLVANLISLTPGTLTLDVAPDRSFLMIHTIYGRDPAALVDELKSGMEHRVREVFRP